MKASAVRTALPTAFLIALTPGVFAAPLQFDSSLPSDAVPGGTIDFIRSMNLSEELMLLGVSFEDDIPEPGIATFVRDSASGSITYRSSENSTAGERAPGHRLVGRSNTMAIEAGRLYTSGYYWSPDCTGVYCFKEGIQIYTIDPEGELAFESHAESSFRSPGPLAIETSPDGRYLQVAEARFGYLTAWRIEGGDGLVEVGESTRPGADAVDVAVSNERNYFVTAVDRRLDETDSLVLLTPDPANGVLRAISEWTPAEDGLVGELLQVATSPDGRTVYASLFDEESNSSGVLRLGIDDDLAFTFADLNTEANTLVPRSLVRTRALTVSTDGRQLFVADRDSLHKYTADPSGQLIRVRTLVHRNPVAREPVATALDRLEALAADRLGGGRRCLERHRDVALDRREAPVAVGGRVD